VTARIPSELAKGFWPLIVESSPLVDPPPEREVTWLAQRLVAQIAFQEWTADRKLRQPAFLGLRDDEPPTDCLLPKAR
jgi:bifunctional non-homologous end joining protein LigD